MYKCQIPSNDFVFLPSFYASCLWPVNYCLTLQAPLSLMISWSLSRVMSAALVMLSSPLNSDPSSPSSQPFSRIKDFSNELAVCHRWPYYWRFNFSIISPNEYSGLGFSLKIVDLTSLCCPTRDSQSLFQTSHFETTSSCGPLPSLHGPALPDAYVTNETRFSSWTFVSRVKSALLFQHCLCFRLSRQRASIVFFWFLKTRSASTNFLFRVDEEISSLLPPFSPSICHESDMGWIPWH